MSNRTDSVPTFDEVRAAARVLAGRIHRTPLWRSSTLGHRTGGEVLLKVESFQRTGSFKVRGNLNRLARLDPAARTRGVVAASAGNHAQGLALAASLDQVPCVVVMPTTVQPAKLAAVRAYGAEVELLGTIFDDCVARAEELARARGMTLVDPCADRDVIAGHGTIGLEIVEERPDIDHVVVPVGGGGLMAGVAAAVHGLRPGVRITGVQPEGSQPMALSLAAGKLVPHENAASIADGLAGREVDALTLAAARAHDVRIVTVSEGELLDAMVFLATRAKLWVEASGAAAVAPLLAGRLETPPGSRVACILSGGNQDPALFARWVADGVEGAAIAH